MKVSLTRAIPGWDYEVLEDFAPQVAAGCARESMRLRGHSHVLTLGVSEFKVDGLTESVELLQPVDSLEDGAAHAETEARARADRLREEHQWHELPAGGARAVGPFREAPFMAVRKVGDRNGFTSVYVQVAVLPLGKAEPLDLAFVRLVGLDCELASWFRKVAARP